VKSELGPPMTLGVAAAAGVRLIVCCKACQHGSNLTRGRAGPALRRRDQRSRLARPAGVLAVREPAGRHGGQRDQAARIDMPDPEFGGCGRIVGHLAAGRHPRMRRTRTGMR
jgi:hypothetical protein